MLTLPVRAGRLFCPVLLAALACSCRGPAPRPVASPTPSAAQRQAQQDGLLIAAVRRNDAAQVRALLTQGADPNARDDSGQAHWRSVTAQWKVDTNAHPWLGPTALMIACYEGNDALALILLRAGADPNARGVDYGAARDTTHVEYDLVSHVTPLIESLYRGSPSTLRLLLHHGAAVNARCQEGMFDDSTALDIAHGMIPTSAGSMSEEQMDRLDRMIKLLEKAGAKRGYS